MKKRLISFLLCFTMLFSLIPAVGVTAMAEVIDDGSYSADLSFLISNDDSPCLSALVTLISESGDIYLAEALHKEGDYYCYKVDSLLADGDYSVCVNGYLAKKITVKSTSKNNELKIPCYTLTYKTHEYGAAVGTKLTAEYVAYDGETTLPVLSYAVLPEGGTVNFTAVPAGADTYTGKWSINIEDYEQITAAVYTYMMTSLDTAEDDGSYTHSVSFDGHKDVVFWVKGAYDYQSAADAITLTYPRTGITATKITNPTHGSGEADGLNTNDSQYPANRLNSYAWSLGSSTYTGETTDTLTTGKEYLYVGTNRSFYGSIFWSIADALFYSLEDSYNITVKDLEVTITDDQIYQLVSIALELYFNGDIPQLQALFGNEFYCTMATQIDNWVGQIMRIDPETGDSEVVYTEQGANANGSSYRSVISMNNNLYFFSAFGNKNYIIKIPSDGSEPVKVFKNGIGADLQQLDMEFDLSLRAADVYDASANTMICGGTIGVLKNPETNLWEVSGESDATNSIPAVFLLKDEGNGNYSTQLICDASGAEFNIPKSGSFTASIYSGGIWDICMYHGEPYMTVYQDDTFSLWHGREAGAGEEAEANEYGWIWEKVWSRDYDNDSIEFSFDDEQINADMGFDANANDVTATLCVYNDKLYIGCFDSFAPVYVKTVLSSVINLVESDSGTYLTDTFLDLFNYLNHQPSLFYYDGKTVKRDTEFAKLVADKNVDYLWRMICYDGDLYVTTLDAEIMEDFVVPLRTQRMEHTISKLGVNFDYTYSDILEMVAAMFDVSDDFSSFSYSGKEYSIRPDTTASLLSTLLSSIMTDSSGNAISVSPNEIINNRNLLSFMNNLASEFKSFDSLSDGIFTFEKRIDSIIERYSDVKIIGNITIGDIADAIDISGSLILLRVQLLLNGNEQGFDLYVNDHETGKWSVLITDGLNDPYNYGGRTLAICNDELYIGTANPFYGAQIWRIEREDVKEEDDESAKNPAPITTDTSETSASKLIALIGAGNAASFDDISKTDYFYQAVSWAVSYGVTTGTSATTFSPNASVTRAQLVTFLWRAAGSPEPASNDCPFTDVASDSYYYKAVLWAVENGITTGTSATTFSPDAAVTRAQVVTFLYRYKGSPAIAADAVNPFGDVSADSYYYSAVIWAVNAKITQGLSDTEFAPEAVSTRAQAITLLYRVFA